MPTVTWYRKLYLLVPQYFRCCNLFLVRLGGDRAAPLRQSSGAVRGSLAAQLNALPLSFRPPPEYPRRDWKSIFQGMVDF